MAINRSSGTAQSGFRAIDANVSSGENSTPARRASALSFDGGGAPAGAALRGSPGPSVIVLAPARGYLLPPGLLGSCLRLLTRRWDRRRGFLLRIRVVRREGQPVVAVEAREHARLARRLRHLEGDAVHVEQVAQRAMEGGDALAIADQRLQFVGARVGELLLDLQHLEVRHHAVLVALALGVEVLFGRVARGARGGDLLGGRVDVAYSRADVDGYCLPCLQLNDGRSVEVELRSSGLSSGSDIEYRDTDVQADVPAREVVVEYLAQRVAIVRRAGAGRLSRGRIDRTAAHAVGVVAGHDVQLRQDRVPAM